MENFDQAGIANVPDGDDLRLFAPLDDPQLSEAILQIKRNDPGARELHISCPARADERVWRRLGRILRQNTTVRSLAIVSPDLDDYSAFLFEGIHSNRSMETIRLSGIDLRAGAAVALDSLVPHLSRNPSLKQINLHNCNLGSEGIESVARALADRSEDTLEELCLDANHIPDVDLDRLVLALSGKKSLTQLSLSRNKIGSRGCASLAKLLENERCNLEHLELDGNSINDKAVVVLANSLAKNSKLYRLDLSYNREITGEGLSAILKLVCNYSNSSIEAVAGSNHTLGDIGISLDDLAPALGADDANLLRASLEANATHGKTSATRRKVIWSHARGDLNLGASSIAAGAMPRVMAWIGGSIMRWNGGSFESSLVQYHDPPLPEARLGAVKLDALYRVVRSMPIGEWGEWNRERQPPRELHCSSSSVWSRSSSRSIGGSNPCSAGQYAASDDESIPDDLDPGLKKIWLDLRGGTRERSVPSDLEECQKEIVALRRENEELLSKMKLLCGRMKILNGMMGGGQSKRRQRRNDRGALTGN